MALNDAMVQGLDETMASINTLAPTPFWSVWKGQNIVFQFNEDDKDKGISYLEQNLSALHQNKNRDLYTIKWHPSESPGFITNKTPVIASLSFRITPHDPGAYRLGPDEFRAKYESNAELKQQLALIQSQLSALQADREIDEDPTDKAIGHVTALMDHPVIGMIVGRLVDKIMPAVPGTPAYVQQAAISGPPVAQATPTAQPTQPDIDKINAALEILLSNDPQLPDDLTKLAAMSQKDKSTFNMMLEMLRSRKL